MSGKKGSRKSQDPWIITVDGVTIYRTVSRPEADRVFDMLVHYFPDGAFNFPDGVYSLSRTVRSFSRQDLIEDADEDLHFDGFDHSDFLTLVDLDKELM